MTSKRKTHTAAFKAQIDLAAIKGDKTVGELAARFEVHPTRIHDRKKKLLAAAPSVFESAAKPTTPDSDSKQAELFEQTGRLKVELDRVKKSERPRLTNCGP